MTPNEAILAAVRDVLSPGGRIRSATGPLRRSAELITSLDFPIWPELQMELAIETLSVIEVRGPDAVVDLAAVGHWTGRTFQGDEFSGRLRYSGPVPLVREADGWKVVDLVIDGQSALSKIFKSDLAVERPGLRLSLLGGRLTSTDWVNFLTGSRRSNGVNLFVESSNETGQPISVKRAAFATRAGRTWWHWAHCLLPISTLPPGTVRFEVFAGGDRAPSRAAQKRLLIASDQGLIDMRPASAGHRTRFPLTARSRVWTPRLIVVVALVIAFSIWAGPGSLGVQLAAAALFLGLLETVRLVRARRKPTRRFVAVVGATAVVGIALIAAYGLQLGDSPETVLGRQRSDIEWFINQGASTHKTLISARHMLRRKYSIEWKGTPPQLQCVADVWLVTTNRGRSWVVMTNIAPATDAGSLSDLMLAYSRHEFPTARTVAQFATQSDSAAASAGITGYRLC